MASYDTNNSGTGDINNVLSWLLSRKYASTNEKLKLHEVLYFPRNYHFLNKENIPFDDVLFPLERSGVLPVPDLRRLAFSSVVDLFEDLEDFDRLESFESLELSLDVRRLVNSGWYALRS